MPNLFTTYTPREDMPSLSEIIKEAHRQREGPPVDPWIAAYPHVLALARRMLFNEIKDQAKRDAALKEFDSRIGCIEEGLDQCNTMGDQLFALQEVLEDANFDPLDLRTSREGRGPDVESLLEEYDSDYQQILKIFGRLADRKPAQLVERLGIAFPFLTPRQASKAARSKPSWATCVVIGARYALSPSRIRDLRTEARQRRAREPKDR
jgi:hypothetical protein